MGRARAYPRAMLPKNRIGDQECAGGVGPPCGCPGAMPGLRGLAMGRGGGMAPSAALEWAAGSRGGLRDLRRRAEQGRCA